MRSRRIDAHRGQALVEAGLTLAIFLSLVFGVCEFGRALWTYTLICHAAREGTRYAIVHGSQSGMSTSTATTKIAAKVKEMAVGLDKSKINVTTTWLPDNTPGNSVRVAVTCSFRFVTPYQLPGSTFTIKSTSQMMITN